MPSTKNQSRRQTPTWLLFAFAAILVAPFYLAALAGPLNEQAVRVYQSATTGIVELFAIWCGVAEIGKAIRHRVIPSEKRIRFRSAREKRARCGELSAGAAAARRLDNRRKRKGNALLLE
jgi:hypothetical protein